LPDDSLVHYEVEPNYAGWTLAAYVAEKLKRPLPGDRLDRLLRGRSLVHAERELLPDTKIWPGLRFALRKRSPGDSWEPPGIPVVYEDDALLVVDKPAGLAIHPTARYHQTTLTWALAQRHRNAGGQKPDPAHRLDRETSGLVACGRTPIHTRRLKAAFASRQVGKAYLALVEGAPAEDRFAIDLPLVVGGGRVKVKVRVDPAGAPSSTSCEVIERYEGVTMLRCVPRTGRQHQIRAHLAAIGHPVCGDRDYGGGDCGRRLGLERQFLHSAQVMFSHPFSGEQVVCESKPPVDLRRALDVVKREPVSGGPDGD